ncbi:DUF4138 domain-containing protein [Sphingobacterium suaedae]|uniref:DUF4138 domain-containing protein n=1 Tax=Sphingobacterium suaedae TaxID=1686402 RepID=A0ABW5KKU8_9SPHI
MTNYILSCLICLMTLLAQGQSTLGRKLNDLPEIQIFQGQTAHILSPENIQYVDISSERIVGDLPLANILRLKLMPDTVSRALPWEELGSVTIAGDNFLAQYRLRISSAQPTRAVPVLIDILPSHISPLDISGVALSSSQMKSKALELICIRRYRPVRRVSAFGLTVQVNHVFVVGEYMFFDISIKNATKLPYQADGIRFFIEDKKIVKATNQQSTELETLWQLRPLEGFNKSHRNVFVLKKATFPGSKVLRINMTEKQISGRTIDLKIKYGDILKADTF